MMGLTRCYKTTVFYNLYLLFFRSQSVAEILPLQHLENKRTPYGNSTSGFMMMMIMKLPILPCAEKLELVLSTAPGT